MPEPINNLSISGVSNPVDGRAIPPDPESKITGRGSRSLADSKDLAPADSPIQIKYVPIDRAVFFSENIKRHDLGAIAKSIAKNGFRNPPLWDSNLNDGTGGIVAGNGRTEALQWMHKQGQDAPKGIAVDDEGQWFMPIVFGCDAESEAAAKAFSIDDNSLTMSGSDFTALDMSRLYDQEAYLKMLKDLEKLGELPLTVDDEDLRLLAERLGNKDNDRNSNDKNDRLPKEIYCECPECGHRYIQQLS